MKVIYHDYQDHAGNDAWISIEITILYSDDTSLYIAQIIKKVHDWAGGSHWLMSEVFETEEEAWDYIERNKEIM